MSFSWLGVFLALRLLGSVSSQLDVFSACVDVRSALGDVGSLALRPLGSVGSLDLLPLESVGSLTLRHVALRLVFLLSGCCCWVLLFLGSSLV